MRTLVLLTLLACDPSEAPDIAIAEPLLPGDPEGPALAALPDLPVPDPVDTEDEWLLDLPVPVSRKRFLMVLADGAVTHEINDLLAPYDITLVGANPVAGYLVGEVGPTIDLAILLGDAAGHPGVVAIQPDISRVSMTIPADDPLDADVEETVCTGAFQHWSWESPTSGANWGLKRVGAPFAWTLFDDLRDEDAPGIAVFEKGFDTAHVDLTFDDATPFGDPALEHQSHGTGVASVIAALHNEEGVAGVLPAGVVVAPVRGRVRPTSGFLQSAEIAELDAIVRHVQDTDTQLLNFSAGTLYTNHGQDARPTDGFLLTGYTQNYSDLADHRGTVWHTTFERLARDVRDDFLLFCAAGNDGLRPDGYAFQARDTSGCANAATRLGSPRLLAIENLDPNEGLAPSSQRGGSLAAPGTCIGMAEPQDTYSSYAGTSYAAPFALGAAAVVWMQAPDLDAVEVRTAIEEGAEEGAGGSAIRLNLWGALQAADELEGNGAIAHRIADVDDGSPDGLLRIFPSEEEYAVPDRYGDGCVDLADARALRDAILLAANPYTLDIDGSKLHPARDLNGDGEIFGTLTVADETPPESLWSRFDQNASNSLDVDDIGFLADQWGTCAGAATTSRTQGWEADRLITYDPVTGEPFSELMGTLDVWVPVSDFDETLVMVHGAPAVWVSPNHPDVVVDGFDRYVQRTVPVPCASDLPRVCTRTFDGATLSTLRCAPLPTSQGPGSDIVVDPADGVPVDGGSLLFIDESASHIGGPLTADALRQVVDGVLDPTYHDFEDTGIDLWGLPALSPDLNWAFWPSCVDYVENGDLECLAMMQMPAFERDEARPWDASDFLVRGFSASGRQLLVQERPENSFNDHRFWSVDLGRLEACTGPCDRDELWVHMDPGNFDSVGAPHAVRRDGSMLFEDHSTSGLSIIRSEGPNDGTVCLDPEPEGWFAPAGQHWGLLHSQPSPVASTDRVLAWRDDGGSFSAAIVSPGGAVDALATGYTHLPANAVAWGAGGRSLAIREPGGRLSYSLIDVNGQRIAETELADDPGFAAARLTVSPKGEFVAAYVSAADRGKELGIVYVYETLLGSERAVFEVHDEDGPPMWSAEGNSIAYTIKNTADMRTDLDVKVLRVDTLDVVNLTFAIQDATCDETDPDNCPFSDQRSPVWSRPLR